MTLSCRGKRWIISLFRHCCRVIFLARVQLQGNTTNIGRQYFLLSLTDGSPVCNLLHLQILSSNNPQLMSASITHPCWFSVRTGFCGINDTWGMVALFRAERILSYIFSGCLIGDEADNMWLLYCDRKFFMRWLVKDFKTRRALNTCESFTDWQMTKRPSCTPVGIYGFAICILNSSVKGLVRACQISETHTLYASMRVGGHCHNKDPPKHYHASTLLAVEYFSSVIAYC